MGMEEETEIHFTTMNKEETDYCEGSEKIYNEDVEEVIEHVEDDQEGNNDCEGRSERTNVQDDQEIKEPVAGMVFSSIDELGEYYKAYGKKIGFEVSKRTSSKGDDGELKYMTIACSRFGKSRRTSATTFKLRPMSKTDCTAKIRASAISDGQWKICSVLLDHNHELSTPSKTRYFKSYRVMQPHIKRRLEVNDKAGIRMNKNFGSLVVEAGGHDNLTFQEKDCRNYIEKVRRLELKEGDAVAVQKYFVKMQHENSNFFYMMDLDEEGRLRNLFWADARSRAAFKEFGDVVTFDTTYLTNKYDMPFAPFVGVNHHGQSILFGCGLVSNENVETFTWLFQTWLHCMSDCAPKAIITDQDKAMKKAIEIVFPNARHRWCLWHILKKLPEKMKGYNNYDSISLEMLNIVYESLAIDDFEERWNDFIARYDLCKNEWLHGLYEERRLWVPAFVKDTFWAGMSTTQRSEGINAFFDGYVNAKTTLKQFVEQYDNALRDKVEKENKADFNSFNSQIPCISRYDFERQFQHAYTTSKFKEFQQELAGKLYCEVSSCELTGVTSKFVVNEDIILGEIDKRVSFVACLNKQSHTVTCNCRLFEFRGILCRHAIVVLTHNRIFHISESYILRRWRKDLKRCHTRVKLGYVNWSVTPETMRFDKMCILFNEVADKAADNEEQYNMVLGVITDLKLKLNNVSRTGRSTPSVVDETLSYKEIADPKVVRSKGRPPLLRKKSKIEKIVQKSKEKRKRAKSNTTEIVMEDSKVIK